MSRPFRPSRRRFLLPLGALGLASFTSFAIPWWMFLRMPGSSWPTPIPPASDSERMLAASLRRDVERLAVDIGERNLGHRPKELEAAASWIEETLVAGGYEPTRQVFLVGSQKATNLEVTKRGEREGVLIVGAHYDTVLGSPGANDNGSGVAALLALARMLRHVRTASTLRFVFFTNEEPPYFKTELMGSVQYARRCQMGRDPLVGMVSLDTIGYYDERPGSQRFPFPMGFFYPDRGDFVAFVGDTDAGPFVRRLLSAFRRVGSLPSEGACPPPTVPGVSWSDHASFWPLGIPALMITDTALMRYPHYHRPSDTPDKIDYDRVARLTRGLAEVVSQYSQDV